MCVFLSSSNVSCFSLSLSPLHFYLCLIFVGLPFLFIFSYFLCSGFFFLVFFLCLSFLLICIMIPFLISFLRSFLSFNMYLFFCNYFLLSHVSSLQLILSPSPRSLLSLPLILLLFCCCFSFLYLLMCEEFLFSFFLLCRCICFVVLCTSISLSFSIFPTPFLLFCYYFFRLLLMCV